MLGIPQPDGSILIAASKGGAPENPAWFGNLRAHPDTRIEVGDGEGGVDTVDVTAEVLRGGERDAGWAQFTARSRGFAEYEAKAGGRVIPVVRLTRR